MNELTIQIDNVRIENGQLTMDACYEIPDSRDWTIWKAKLQTAAGEIEMFEMSLIELRQPAINGFQEVITMSDSMLEPDQSNGMGLRCDKVAFLSQVSTPGDFTITIGSILASPSESEVCDPAYLERINEALQTYKNGLVADCWVETYEDGGASGLEIKSWPDEMTKQEAETILGDPDLYIDIHGIRGPWIFSVTID